MVIFGGPAKGLRSHNRGAVLWLPSMKDLRSHCLRQAALAYLLGTMMVLGACQQVDVPNNVENAGQEPEVDLPAAPVPRSLDREAILAAVAQAASAEASGADNAEAQRELDGRQFEFRIRFGCKGPSNRLRDEWLGWSFDSDTGTLRVRARPTLGVGDELLSELGGDQFEAVEGFWIPRPWLLGPVCPAAAPATSGAAASAGGPAPPSQPTEKTTTRDAAAATQGTVEPVPKWPRIGIARFFTVDDARTGRRSMRPYEAVKTFDAKRPIPSNGFNLVLAGRLRALPGGRVIACVAKAAESPPECVVSADFDRVWIEDPDTRDVIAEWGRG